MLRAIPLLSALALLLSSTSQAALVSAAPASLPPASSENASTAFLNDGSESRIGLLCHNDPVNKNDPFGLKDSGVTDDVMKKAKESSQKATLALLRWLKAVINAERMTKDFLTGGGPGLRIFGSNSLESNNLRRDPGYGPKVGEALASKTGWAHRDFNVGSAILAGLNPTRQFVGSYDVMVAGKGQEATVFVFNQTSVWSGAYHQIGTPGGYDRPGAGGNTYQLYIMGPLSQP